MADAALIFEIDSSQAEGAARALAGLNKYAAATATVAAKLETQFRKTNGQFQSQIDYVAENERDIRRLAQAYNPTLDAQLRFAEAQKEVARAVQLGVIPANQQADVLRRLQAQYALTTVATKSLFKGMAGGVHQVQNLSYQVGDFFVQIASGQNVMMALSQQLPQALGGFGMIGAAAGAAAAILGAMWMIYGEGAEKAKTLSEANDELAASIGRLNDIAQNYSAQGIDSLIQKYGQLDAQILLLIEKQREFALNEAMALAMRAITDDSSRLADFMNQVNTAINIGGSSLKGFLRDFNLTYDQAIQLRNAVNDVNKATDVMGKARALANLTNVMKSVGMEAENVYGQLVNAESQLRELYNVSNQAGWFNAALNGITSVYNKVVDTVNESLKLNVDAAGNSTGFGAGSRARSRPNRAPTDIDFDLPEPSRGGGGGGGGSRAIEQAEKQFQTLRELLEKETLFQAAEYEKRQAQLENALAKGVITEQKYQTMRDELRTFYFGSEYEKNALNYQMSLEQLNLYLEQDYLTRQQYEAKKAMLQWEYTNQSLDLNSTLVGAQLNGLGEYFGNANTMAGGGYESLLRLQKSFAAASAFISAYDGASKALADPTLTTWQRIAAAGKVLTTGLGFVNAIKGASMGGGGGGAGGGGALSAQPAAPSRYYNITLTDMSSRDEEFALEIAERIIGMQEDSLINITGGRR